MAGQRFVKIGWNANALRGLTKAAFVRRFADIYPGVDLGAEYDRLFPTRRRKAGNGQEPQQ